MRTLAEINKERKELIWNATKLIVKKRERNRRYTPAELSEMCDGLITPETFRKCFARAEYQARMDASVNSRSRTWRSDKSHLFGDWVLEYRAYPVARVYEVKWFDENGKVVKTSKRYMTEYEVEFF